LIHLTEECFKMIHAPSDFHENLDANEIAVLGAAQTAARAISPLWPLDSFVAVNPFLGWSGQSVAATQAELGARAGAHLTMSMSFYREAWGRGDFTPDDIAATLTPSDPDLAACLAALTHEAPEEPHTPLTSVTDLGRAILWFRGNAWPWICGQARIAVFRFDSA
jgi:hypothetical protein